MYAAFRVRHELACGSRRLRFEVRGSTGETGYTPPPPPPPLPRNRQNKHIIQTRRTTTSEPVLGNNKAEAPKSQPGGWAWHGAVGCHNYATSAATSSLAPAAEVCGLEHRVHRDPKQRFPTGAHKGLRAASLAYTTPSFLQTLAPKESLRPSGLRLYC